MLVVAAFAALAASVVHDRRPLHGALTASFTAAVEDAGLGTVQGCPKEPQSSQYYHCRVALRRGDGLRPYYRVWLHDDGCWDSFIMARVPARVAPVELEGCID